MRTTRTALVIGGGIAGPVTAMALQQAGISAVVYEAYDTAADGVGGILTIAPNGLAALDVLGATEAVVRVSGPMPALVLQSSTGKKLGEISSPADLPQQRYVSRPALYRALLDEAARRGIRVERGRRLVDVTETGEAVTAHFADGSQASADVLVGADGIRSTVRGLLDPAAPQPRYGGLINFAGQASDTGLASTGGRMYMVFGKRAFLGYQVADDGSSAWFVNLPQQQMTTTAQARQITTARWLDRLRDAFAGDRTHAPALLARTRPADLLVIGPVEDLPRVPVWSRGRMVLVGDAAHATSPSSGQGASLAIESAVQLARCLRDLPHQEAFAAYEQLRRARVEKIIAAAARTNQSKAAGPVARVLRDLMMPVFMKRLATPEKMAWQFGHRIDWDTPVTRSGNPVRV